MKLRFASVALVVVGVLLGLASNSYRQVEFGPPAALAGEVAESQDREIVAQLKELNGQLKDLNAFLRSGRLRVVGVMNPDLP